MSALKAIKIVEEILNEEIENRRQLFQRMENRMAGTPEADHKRNLLFRAQNRVSRYEELRDLLVTRIKEECLQPVVGPQCNVCFRPICGAEPRCLVHKETR